MILRRNVEIFRSENNVETKPHFTGYLVQPYA